MNAGGGNTSYSSVKPELIDAMKDSDFYKEKPQSEAVVDTSKQTSNNNDRADVTTKVLSYPIARRNDSATDYLSMEIARYQAPGLELPAFDEEKGLGGFVSDFSLKTGSSQQVFKKDKTIDGISIAGALHYNHHSLKSIRSFLTKRGCEVRNYVD